jgi:hypothetical protein
MRVEPQNPAHRVSGWPRPKATRQGDPAGVLLAALTRRLVEARSNANSLGRFAMCAIATCLALMVPLASVLAADLIKASVQENATHDPDGIWRDADLTPFRPGKSMGATITQYRVRAASGEWVLSQILTGECSLQLCPARLVLIKPNGTKKVAVDDMMHVGGPFILSKDERTLKNGDYEFVVNAK